MTYFNVQIVIIAIGFYRLMQLGLLPISPSDWLFLISDFKVNFLFSKINMQYI